MERHNPPWNSTYGLLPLGRASRHVNALRTTATKLVSEDRGIQEQNRGDHFFRYILSSLSHRLGFVRSDYDGMQR